MDPLNLARMAVQSIVKTQLKTAMDDRRHYIEKCENQLKAIEATRNAISSGMRKAEMTTRVSLPGLGLAVPQSTVSRLVQKTEVAKIANRLEKKLDREQAKIEDRLSFKNLAIVTIKSALDCSPRKRR